MPPIEQLADETTQELEARLIIEREQIPKHNQLCSYSLDVNRTRVADPVQRPVGEGADRIMADAYQTLWVTLSDLSTDRRRIYVMLESIYPLGSKGDGEPYGVTIWEHTVLLAEDGTVEAEPPAPTPWINFGYNVRYEHDGIPHIAPGVAYASTADRPIAPALDPKSKQFAQVPAIIEEIAHKVPVLPEHATPAQE